MYSSLHKVIRKWSVSRKIVNVCTDLFITYQYMKWTNTLCTYIKFKTLPTSFFIMLFYKNFTCASVLCLSLSLHTKNLQISLWCRLGSQMTSTTSYTTCGSRMHPLESSSEPKVPHSHPMVACNDMEEIATNHQLLSSMRGHKIVMLKLCIMVTRAVLVTRLLGVETRCTIVCWSTFHAHHN